MFVSRKKEKKPGIKSFQKRDEKLFIRAGILLILVMTFLAYVPAIKAGYIWDDDDHFTKNEMMNDWRGLGKIWTSASAVYYPLVLTSFWIMRRLWALHPLPYHAVNILFHTVNALLLWAILRRMGIRGAFWAGALFALHPVHVESVAWVTELKNTQSGFFYLLSFLFFHKYYTKGAKSAGEGKDDQRKNILFLISLFLFLLALLSKPSTVMLPAALILFLWWKEGWVKIRHFLMTSPFFILSLFSSAWTIWEQKFHSGARGVEWSETMVERLLNAGRIVWFYLLKLLFPHPLIFIYPRWDVNAGNVFWYAPSGLLILAIVVFWLKRRSFGKPLLFGLGYFVILLFPVLGFFNIYFMRFSYVGDHFQYLASMGPLGLCAAGIAAISERMKFPRERGQILFWSVILVILGILVWRQAGIYKNEETLWRDTIEKNPGAWIAYHNLGFEMMLQDRNKEAMDYYERSLVLKPDYWEAYFNMGLILAKEGKPDKAVGFFQKALALNPLEKKIHSDLALALSKQKRFGEALGEIDSFLSQEPKSPPGLYNKATILSDMGRSREAIWWYEKAIEVSPDFYQAHTDLGNAYYKIGDEDRAIMQYEKALSINPGDEAAQTNLRIIRQKNRKAQEAFK